MKHGGDQCASRDRLSIQRKCAGMRSIGNGREKKRERCSLLVQVALKYSRRGERASNEIATMRNLHQAKVISHSELLSV